MAIYKPTNCSPYLTTFDSRVEAGSPQFFECRVDSSNKNADGYSIILYDEDNEQVFPVRGVSGAGANTTWTNVAQDENITFVSDLTAITGNGIRSVDEYYYIQSSGYTNLNTGINGTYLRIPFFMNIDDVGEFISCNTIYVNTSDEDSPEYYAITEAGANAIAPGTAWNSISSSYKVNLTQLIQNGYSYKWAITLYQGQRTGDTIVIPPKDIKYYDMTLTTGQTLGSYMERIQSVLSEEIYIDYYIQPVYISRLNVRTDSSGNWDPTNWTGGTITKIGSRARIKNYDSTYGYIYPQVGDSGLADGCIDQSATPGSTVANGFQIYSMSNNEDDLAATRKVWAAFNNYTIPFDWENYISDASQSQGQQHIYVLQDENDSINISLEGGRTLTISGVGGTMSSSSFYPFDVTVAPLTFEGESSPRRVWVLTSRNVAVSSSARIILNHQAPATSTWYTGASDDPERSFIIPDDFPDGSNSEDLADYLAGYSGSAYNGIFVPSLSGGESVTASGHEWRHYVVTWARPSDADTWGEISNKVVMVTGTANGWGSFGGANVQIDWTGKSSATAVGTINETAILFINERPLEIYSYTRSSNPNINTTGIIFYNQEETTSSVGRLFIRPFTGISRGMYWQEMGPVRSSKRQFIIDSVNTDYWYITYRTLGSYNTGGQETNMVNDLIPLDTRYQIKSFYRMGDENPFDLEKSPEITLLLFYDEDRTQQAGTEYLDSEGTIAIIDQRNVYAYAEYSQDNYVSWRSYQWFLYEGRGTSGQILQNSDVEYSGEPQYRFYGFLDNQYYTIVLYMETESGTIIERTQYIYVQFQETTLEFPLTWEYECDTHSVSLSFVNSNYGFIFPNAIYTDGGLNYSRYQSSENPNDSTPLIGGVSYGNGIMSISSFSYNSSANPTSLPLDGVEYAYASSDTNENNLLTPIIVDENIASFQTKIRLANEDYEGDIIGVQTGEDGTEFGYEYDFTIYIPDMTESVTIGGCYETNVYTISSGEEYQMRYRIAQRNSVFEDRPVTIQRSDGTVSEDGIWWNYDRGNGLRVRPIIISGWQNNNYIVPSNSYSRLVSGIDSLCMVTGSAGNYTVTMIPTSTYPYVDSLYQFNLIGSANVTINFPAQNNALYWDFEVETGQFMVGGEEFRVKGGTDESFWSDYERETIRIARNGGYVISDDGTETFTAPTSDGLRYRSVVNIRAPQYWNDSASGENQYWIDGDSYNGNSYPAIPNVITQIQMGSSVSSIHPEITDYVFSFAANLENFSLDGGVPTVELAVYEEDNL